MKMQKKVESSEENLFKPPHLPKLTRYLAVWIKEGETTMQEDKNPNTQAEKRRTWQFEARFDDLEE